MGPNPTRSLQGLKARLTSEQVLALNNAEKKTSVSVVLS